MGDDRANVYTRADGVTVYRASSLGNCIKGLVAARLGMAALPWPDDYKRRFADGDLHEGAVLDVLRAEGVTITDEQYTVELRLSDTIAVVGHIDAMGLAIGAQAFSRLVGQTLNPDDASMALVEVKAFSKSMWDTFKLHGFAQWPRYEYQLSSYMIGMGGDREFLPALVAAKNKNTGEIAYRWVPTPPMSRTDIMLRVVQVEAGARTGELPACDRRDFPCQYFYLHDEVAGEGDADENVTTMVDALASEYVDARDRENASKALKQEFGEKLHNLLGDGGKVSTPRYTVSFGAGTPADPGGQPTTVRKFHQDKVLAALGMTQEQYDAAFYTNEVGVSAPTEAKPGRITVTAKKAKQEGK